MAVDLGNAPQKTESVFTWLRSLALPNDDSCRYPLVRSALGSALGAAKRIEGAVCCLSAHSGKVSVFVR
jgi:hypothetical protein